MNKTKDSKEKSKQNLPLVTINFDNDHREKLSKICECNRIISDTDITEFGDLSKFNNNEDDILLSFDEYNEDLEDEFFKLYQELDLDESTHSLSKIETVLPTCLKYGFRSGSTHVYSKKFSPLTRGLMSPQASLAAIATTFLIKADCWNEVIIDQILEDGDRYYTESYANIKIDDRRKLTLLDFKENLEIQNSHRIYLKIDDPLYVGTFRSETPKDLHIAKALILFFRRYDTGILTSPILNIAIWKNSKNFLMFDAQPRLDNCAICDAEGNGSAKLIMVQNLAGLLFIILQKSNVQNEFFTLYGITIENAKTLAEVAETEKELPLPKLTPIGFSIKNNYRAIARGSYHLHHPYYPKEFHGRGHLVVAVITLIYSKLLSASKWTTPIIDLILNYSNIYLTDLVRILGKTLDQDFQISIKDLLTDIIFGVYTAKINIDENVFPGEDIKSKDPLEGGLRKFFSKYSLGIFEIKATYYPIWKESNKFYLLDPFACDSEGFRVSPDDSDEIEQYEKATSCVTMNSTICELIDIIGENTEFTPKDCFVIHGFNLLYVKSGNPSKSKEEKVVYREKKINHRPLRPPTPTLIIIDEYEKLKTIPTLPHFEPNHPENKQIQYPELMDKTELFINIFDETNEAPQRKKYGVVSYYAKVKPHRLFLPGSINCLNEDFKKNSQGRQGLIIAIAALTLIQQINLPEWTSIEIDKIITGGNKVYERVSKQILDKLEKLQPLPKNSKNQEAQKLKVPRILNKLELFMLPETLKFSETVVSLISKMNVVEGEFNPLINLGEAFQRYFEQYNKLILENKNLFYSIWKNNNKYFILNPYGSDIDGWRNSANPAALFAVDSISELTYLCYGLLEYNDYHFVFHFLQIKIQSKDNNYNAKNISLPTFEISEKYKTKFLPITEEQFAELKEIEINSNIDNSTGKENSNENKNEKLLSVDNINIIDLFAKTEEPKHTEVPKRLNFSLITGVIKVDKHEKMEENIEIYYEKLKYNHPPPFVVPQRNLCNLLDTKLASKPMHSLISKFSVDHKLSIKKKNVLDVIENTTNTATDMRAKIDTSKIITLPSKQYFILQSLPSGLTPIRAINNQYIHNECIEEENRDCENDEKVEMVPQIISPTIIPCGPCIRTPEPKKLPDCPEKNDKFCSLNKKDQNDIVMSKLICSTENLLLRIMLPDFTKNEEETDSLCETTQDEIIEIKKKDKKSAFYGFMETDDKYVGIISGNINLSNREKIDNTHYKSCYYSATLCILTKINMDINKFHPEILDTIILIAKKINNSIGNLRYKIKRWFRNFYILGVKCNFIVNQVQYFDPENYDSDNIEFGLKSFLYVHQSGLAVFGNITYAFWVANDMFYLFDSYACDNYGKASSQGTACLMQFCNFEAFVNRIIENTGTSSGRPYRLYNILVTHLEDKGCHKKKRKRIKCPKVQPPEECPSIDECEESVKLIESESKISLMEISDWIHEDNLNMVHLDSKIPKFVTFKNYNASVLEIEIKNTEVEKARIFVYDTQFYKSCLFRESFDLCIIAWSQIHEPRVWKEQVFQALYQASKDYALDSLLTTEDSTVPRTTDNLISEFNISNYCFRVVFAPMHEGTLYVNKGWNLAMSLKKLFDSPIYTGAVLVCDKIHIGIMRKNCRLYAWWLVKATKSIKMIVSNSLTDYLKLLIKEIKKPNETKFSIRIVTISYVKIFGPNCGDIEGLHQAVTTSTSDSQIHRHETAKNSLCDIFRPIENPKEPIFILGSVALNERDLIMEPCIKRCYFVAVFAVVLKRDIIQNPLPGMIDKILELAENSYKLFEKPKFHTEHILKGVNLMDRVFDFRDCALQLVSLLDEKTVFFDCVRAELKCFFTKYTSGIIQFSNCCYGFWYCEAYSSFYYLDPYECDKNGKRVNMCGAGCLCIFPTLCSMVQHMYRNKYQKTTGFFIHRIHVETVNTSPYTRFKEDPIWIYLDYHWSYRHSIKTPTIISTKHGNFSETSNKRRWKNYVIEVPNLIYSLWGSMGVYNSRYHHNGKNQMAIAIAVFALRNLCHPSEWSPPVLNAAVVCGEYYYNQSKKVSTRCRNKLNLQNFFKVSSFQWNVEFKLEVCGNLFANSSQRNLVDAMDMAFKRSSNVMLICEQKVLSIMQTSDAFYITDSSWTGPPLFNYNHGAIYTIRCKNTNTLIYVVIKILNTNQTLQFTLIPVNLVFIQQTCYSKDMKLHVNLRKLLEKSVISLPGKTSKHSYHINGNIVVSDEDSYLHYNHALQLGLKNRSIYENSCMVTINECNKDECKNSVKQKTNKKKLKDLKILQSDAVSFDLSKSFSSILDRNISCHQLVNLVEISGKTKTVKKATCKKKKIEKKFSFIYDELRSAFDKYNAYMKKEYYKTKSHEYKEEKKCHIYLPSK